MIEARKIYADWWYKAVELSNEANDAMKALPGGGEDLEDFLESIATLLTFGPHPRQFPREDS